MNSIENIRFWWYSYIFNLPIIYARRTASCYLGKSKNPRAFDILIEDLKIKRSLGDWEYKKAVIKALQDKGDPEAIQPLIKFAETVGNWEDLDEVCLTISSFGLTTINPLLISLTKKWGNRPKNHLGRFISISSEPFWFSYLDSINKDWHLLPEIKDTVKDLISILNEPLIPETVACSCCALVILDKISDDWTHTKEAKNSIKNLLRIIDYCSYGGDKDKAFKALNRIDPEWKTPQAIEAIPLILELLNVDCHPDNWEGAIRLLQKINDWQVKIDSDSIINSMLKRVKPDYNSVGHYGEACRVLNKYFETWPYSPQGKKFIESLVEQANSIDFDEQIYSIKLMGLGEIKQCLPYLITILNDSNKTDIVRVEAAKSMSKMGNLNGLPFLHSALLDKGKKSEIRKKIAEILGEIRDKSSINHLHNVIIDPSSDIITSAVEALGKIGDKQSSRVLVNTITFKCTNQDPTTVYLKALGRIGDSTVVSDILSFYEMNGQVGISYHALDPSFPTYALRATLIEMGVSTISQILYFIEKVIAKKLHRLPLEFFESVLSELLIRYPDAISQTDLLRISQLPDLWQVHVITKTIIFDRDEVEEIKSEPIDCSRIRDLAKKELDKRNRIY